MSDRLIHQRVFKVSNALNRLDLLCEQHRRQLEPRDGLPDWERPCTPAGKASRRHDRTPAFFAWNEVQEPLTRQPQTPQKVARTLEMAEEAVSESSSNDESMEDDTAAAAEFAQSSLRVGEGGEEEATAIEIDNDDRSLEEDQPVVTGRSIAVSPAKEDILDRITVASGTTKMAPSRNPTRPPPVEVSPSPFRSTSSIRYKHGHRLLATDAAIPTPRSQLNAAGVSTEQADRYRMSRTSGKRFRSPARRTTLWDDLSNSYIHQSGAGIRNIPSFSHKRQALPAAERTFGGSSVFRTLNMDTDNWSRPELMRGERQPVLTGPQAMNVANHAVREFLGGNHEESKRSEPDASHQHQQNSVENVTMELANSERISAPATRYRKSKRVSFGGDSNVDLSLPQPRTLPVLADKTTQTDEPLLSVRKKSRFDEPSRRNSQGMSQNSPARCAACETTLVESERPRKMQKTSTDTAGANSAQEQHTYRRRRSFNHLTNPIMTNPRYPPEPTTFRGRTTYSSAFNDRLAWR